MKSLKESLVNESSFKSGAPRIWGKAGESTWIDIAHTNWDYVYMMYDNDSGEVNIFGFNDINDFAEAQGIDVEELYDIDLLAPGEVLSTGNNRHEGNVFMRLK